MLRPHYAYIEAKRLATRFGKRKPQWERVEELIEDATVMSPAEVQKARKLVATAGAAAPAKKLAKTLDHKAGRKAGTTNKAATR